MALLNYGNPIRFEFGAVKHLPEALAKLGIVRPLIATDAGLRAAGLVERIVDTLDLPEPVCIYDATPANPTEDAVTEALALYRSAGCTVSCASVAARRWTWARRWLCWHSAVAPSINTTP